MPMILTAVAAFVSVLDLIPGVPMVVADVGAAVLCLAALGMHRGMVEPGAWRWAWLAAVPLASGILAVVASGNDGAGLSGAARAAAIAQPVTFFAAVISALAVPAVMYWFGKWGAREDDSPILVFAMAFAVGGAIHNAGWWWALWDTGQNPEGTLDATLGFTAMTVGLLLMVMGMLISAGLLVKEGRGRWQATGDIRA